MLLRITHRTDLSYSQPISESVMELRVAPRQEQDQHRLGFTLAIGPPAAVTSYFDWLGNLVHGFTIVPRHEQIRIVATSVVECDRLKAQPERFRDAWPIEGDGDYTLWDFLQFGGATPDDPRLGDLVRDLDPSPGMSLGELALRIVHLINDRFEYQKGATTAASPITDLLDHGRGVCQDFTHLMIALARKLGIPARYVSGVVHPDSPQFRGSRLTHAWCELRFPSAGWIGFDVANFCVVGGNYVKIAVGREFRDASPNRGLFRGAATETMDVVVETQPLTSLPHGLVPERIEALPAPPARQAQQQAQARFAR